MLFIIDLVLIDAIACLPTVPIVDVRPMQDTPAATPQYNMFSGSAHGLAGPFAAPTSPKAHFIDLPGYQPTRHSGFNPATSSFGSSHDGPSVFRSHEPPFAANDGHSGLQSPSSPGSSGNLGLSVFSSAADTHPVPATGRRSWKDSEFLSTNGNSASFSLRSGFADASPEGGSGLQNAANRLSADSIDSAASSSLRTTVTGADSNVAGPKSRILGLLGKDPQQTPIVHSAQKQAHQLFGGTFAGIGDFEIKSFPKIGSKTSVAAYEDIAADGYLSMKADLGTWFRDGNPERGIPQDFNKAKLWLTRAAEDGEQTAYFKLGEMHEGKSDVAAFNYYSQASRLDRKAAYRLGVMYLEGRGAKKNTMLAVKNIERAANSYPANIPAEMLLGDIYSLPFTYKKSNGAPVTVDMPELAVRHYSVASEAGYGRATTSLAQMYEKGFKGQKPDLPKAMALYEKAAGQGSEEAKARLLTHPIIGSSVSTWLN